MAKLKFIRGTPRALYRSALADFVDAFRAAPLDTALVVPRPGMAMEVRATVLRGMVVPTFCVTDLDDLVRYLFDQNEKGLRQVGGWAAKRVIRQVLLGNEARFQPLVRDGEVSEETLDGLYTLAATLRDFHADLGRFREDGGVGIDVPLFLRLYLERMASLGLVDPMGGRGTVAGRLQEWYRAAPLFRRLVVIGPFEPTPSQASLLRALVEVCDDVIYHHPFVPGHGKVFVQGTVDLGREMEVLDLPPDERDMRRLALIRPWGEGRVDLGAECAEGRFLDPLAEARQVAQRIATLLEQGVDPNSIAIYLPERREALPLVRDVLSDFEIPFRTDLGAPLSTSPAVQAALSVLDAVDQAYSPGSIRRLLSSPYLRWPREGERLWHMDVDRLARMAGVRSGRKAWSAGLERLMAELQAQAEDPEVPEARRAIALRDRERAAAVLPALEALLDELGGLEGSKGIAGHVAAFRDALERLGAVEAVGRHARGEGNEARAFQGLLRTLAALEAEGRVDRGAIPPQGFLAELRRQLAGATYQPEGTNDLGVMVGGYRSLEGHEFEHSFLAFTVEGDMPKLGVRHPFLTSQQAKAIGLLGEEDILRQERYYFLGAFMGGASVLISHPFYQEGKRALPSPFLQDLERKCTVAPMEEAPITRSRRCAQMALGTMLAGGSVPAPELWSDRVTLPPAELCARLNVERGRQGEYRSPHDGVLSDPEVLETIIGNLGAKVFSPSMLEAYRKCPMHYLLRYVLYLAPLEEDLEAMRLGTAAHEVLCRFYRRRAERGLGMPSPDEELTAVKREIREIGREVAARFKGEGADSEARYRALIGDEGYDGTLGTFVDRQATADLPRWRPEYLEYSFGSRVAGDRYDPRSTERPAVIPLTEGAGDVLLLRGKVDRVDVDGNAMLVIDYKTGKAPSYKSLEKGYSMQLQLYLLACAQLLGLEPAGGAYYQLKDDGFGMQLRVADPRYKDALGGTPTPYATGLRKDLECALSNAREALEGMAAGAFHPVDSLEQERCPRSCPYSRICRKDEMRVLAMTLARGEGR
ncbi:MAG TPA: PD-(D/E)XK nuclease family protein [Methanomassiliicoccales archaeon]|nr:PD-(D/E)XK nuclease family protein [Methanomassiliicoccales archaeon]